jgi:hypothetical protein
MLSFAISRRPLLFPPLNTGAMPPKTPRRSRAFVRSFVEASLVFTLPFGLSLLDG